MKVYEGKRTIDGITVTVDGEPLDERTDVKQFTPYGFEWTYEGDAPRQLALAILADHLDHPKKALELTETFMREVIANLDNDWTLTSSEVDAALPQEQGG